ncbi:21558_t:CDS:2, partial [Racocetra persica]
QDLYKQALVSTELENDSWKEINTDDIPVLQEINYEETSDEFTEEISLTRAKPIISCIIIDNDHKEIRYYNLASKGYKIDLGCVEIYLDDTTSALCRFVKLIEMVAQSENNGVKNNLLRILFSYFENFDLDLLSAQSNKLPSLFVINTVFKIKNFDFSKQQFTQKPKKYEESEKLFALEILKL